ncbi:hypothetical protein ACFQGT_06305 [Natrialbaceae archaeon GCM10025810]|uniref:hypothetical protein n=1 Tax=Halovalidus salilacus TaxID=3075124 RepID=UPI00361D8522
MSNSPTIPAMMVLVSGVIATPWTSGRPRVTTCISPSIGSSVGICASCVTANATVINAILSNYQDEEKEVLYSNFIDYGRKCDIVELEVNNNDLLENEYRIVYSAPRSRAKQIEELTGKMAAFEMQEILEKRLTVKKKEIVTELEQDHATGGVTLDDFVNSEDSGRSSRLCPVFRQKGMHVEPSIILESIGLLFGRQCTKY